MANGVRKEQYQEYLLIKKLLQPLPFANHKTKPEDNRTLDSSVKIVACIKNIKFWMRLQRATSQE